MKMTHNDLRKFVIDYLRAQGCYCWPNSTVGVFDPVKKIYRRNATFKGPADVMCVMKGGQHLEVEVKIGKDQLRPEQRIHATQVISKGGRYLVARTPEQFQQDYLALIWGPREEVHYLREFREEERIK